MIVLDTNVLSELMRPAPDQAVIAWLDMQEPARLFLTAITVAEVLYGIARLPEGKRKAGLLELADAVLQEDFAGRILAFDETAAAQYAELACERQQSGRPISMADAQIAAICRSLDGATLATRNVSDFEGTRLALLNPWAAA
ncbi:MAG: type II toxin-antitoxin system VapC family toxin [Noviherbaspirillum sp.]